MYIYGLLTKDLPMISIFEWQRNVNGPTNVVRKFRKLGKKNKKKVLLDHRLNRKMFIIYEH